MKNVKRYVEFLEDIASGDYSWRETSLNDEINGLVIDTSFVPDICKWETGIQKDNQWIIVEHYKDIDEAKKGHKKWVELIKINPNMELKSIMSFTDWFLDKKFGNTEDQINEYIKLTGKQRASFYRDKRLLRLL